jgi:GntR family transcriptional regulator, histidine utilization repressor
MMMGRGRDQRQSLADQRRQSADESRQAQTLHMRIRKDIERKILSGKWPPGHRIPFEHELTARYGCSRMTVNKVMTALAAAGMISRRRRAGSFVSAPHPHVESVILSIPDLSQEVASRGHQYSFKLLSRRRRKSRRSVPQERELTDGDVLLLRGLHLADDRPFALEDRAINIHAVSKVLDMDFSRTAPGSWLLHHIPWTRAQHRISAVNTDAMQAKRLQVETGAACLVLERQTWRGEMGVTWVKQVFLGGSYDLIARFTPGGS